MEASHVTAIMDQFLFLKVLSQKALIFLVVMKMGCHNHFITDLSSVEKIKNRVGESVTIQEKLCAADTDVTVTQDCKK